VAWVTEEKEDVGVSDTGLKKEQTINTAASFRNNISRNIDIL
jgi:hypothetical protein